MFGPGITDLDRQLSKLGTKDREIEIPILAEKGTIDFGSSKIITPPLVAIIITQRDSIQQKN